MKLKIATPMSMLISSLIYIGLGIFFIFSWSLGLGLLTTVVIVTFFVMAAIMIFGFLFTREKKNLSSLFGGILYLILAIVIKSTPSLFSGSLSFIVGIWAGINFLWRIVLCVQLHKNQDNEFWGALIDCGVSLVFSVLFLSNPMGSVSLLCILIGIYLLFHGLASFGDFIREILRWDLDGKHIKRYIKIAPPIFLTAFLPQKAIEKINKSLAVNKEIPKVIELQNADKKYLDTKLEVFIHMAPQIAMGFGHCDISFDGKVYSYGTYDVKSQKVFGLISDGVLAKMDRDDYIKHCLNKDKEHIVGFSIWLSKEQENDMKLALENLTNNCVRWLSPAEETNSKDCDDPASLFYYDSGAEFYKFSKGKFKTYFALSTNCVMLADTLIKAAGLDSIQMNGIVTPGTYMSFLDEQFSRKNSVVVKRTVLV